MEAVHVSSWETLLDATAGYLEMGVSGKGRDKFGELRGTQPFQMLEKFPVRQYYAKSPGQKRVSPTTRFYTLDNLNHATHPIESN